MRIHTSERGGSADTNKGTGILTQATHIAGPSFSKVRRVPKREITASTMRHIMIHVATTTAGPWSLAVIVPYGGKEPPLPWNSRTSGRADADIDSQSLAQRFGNIGRI